MNQPLIQVLGYIWSKSKLVFHKYALCIYSLAISITAFIIYYYIFLSWLADFSIFPLLINSKVLIY